MTPQTRRVLELIEQLKKSPEPETRRTAKALELMLGPVTEGLQKALDSGVPGLNVAGAAIMLTADAVANILVHLPRHEDQAYIVKQAEANFSRSLSWSMMEHRAIMEDIANDNRP